MGAALLVKGIQAAGCCNVNECGQGATMADVESISGKRWQLIYFENHRTDKYILLFRHIINYIHTTINLSWKTPIKDWLYCQLLILLIVILVKNLVDVNRLIKWHTESICVPGRMLKCS